MFYDERIYRESGKIYRNGILLCCILTLLYGVLRGYNLFLLQDLHFKYLSFEFFTCLTGFIILMSGELKWVFKRDERDIFDKYAFYNKAGKIFLYASVCIYVLSVPFNFDRNSHDLPPNYILIQLEIIALVFFYYSFKAKGINFNYSFIGLNGGEYYFKVFKNIGTFCLILLVPFALALLRCIFDLGAFLSILYSYLYSSLSLSAVYFFISFIEKLSFDKESEKINISAYILFILSVAFSILYLIIYSNYNKIISEGTASGNLGERVAAFQTLLLIVNGYAQAFKITFICNMLTYFKRYGNILTPFAVYIAMAIFDIAKTTLFQPGTLIFLNQANGESYLTFVRIYSFITYAVAIINVLLVLWQTVTVVNKVKLTPLAFISPVLLIINFALEIFLYSQGLNSAAVNTGIIAGIVALSAAFVCLARHKFKFEE